MKITGALIAGFFGLPYFYSDIKIYSSQNSRVLEYVTKIPEINEGFYSTPWLNMGLLQSLLGSTPVHLFSDLTKIQHINYTRETHRFSDGGTYSVDKFGPESKKILFIVPGLTGGSDAPYIKHIVNEASNQGFHVIVMNGRGINGTPLTVMYK